MHALLLKGLTFLLTLLPKPIQWWIYHQAHLDHREISFHVEPYSMWVGYKITNESHVQSMIPADLELAAVPIYENLPPEKYLLFNFFRVKSEYFEGFRLEIVTTAKNPSGHIRFVILDYYSDTISSDPMNPFKRPNAVEMKKPSAMSCRLDHRYVLEGSAGAPTLLTTTFGIQANEFIYYGSKTPHRPNALEFDHDSVRRVFRFNIVNLTNQLWNEAREHAPAVSFFYPHNVSFSIIPMDSCSCTGVFDP